MVEGPRGAPVALLFHRVGQSATALEPLARRLARDHHVIVVDLPGHGASSTDIAGGTCLVTDFARRTAEAIRPLVRRPVVAWGAADGAIFALQFALQAPELTAVAVLDRGATAIAATASPAFAARCNTLAAAIRQDGLPALADSTFAAAGEPGEWHVAPGRLASAIEGLGACGNQLADARGLAVPVLLAVTSGDTQGLRAATKLLQSAPPGTTEVLTVEPGADPARSAEDIIRKAVSRNPAAGVPVRAGGRRLRFALAAGMAAMVLAPAAWLLPNVAARDAVPAPTAVPFDPGALLRLVDLPRLEGSHPSVEVVFGSKEPGPAAPAPRATRTPVNQPAQQSPQRSDGRVQVPRTIRTATPPPQPSPDVQLPPDGSPAAPAETPTGATPTPRPPAPPSQTPVPGEPTVPPPGRSLPTGHTCDSAIPRPSTAAEAIDAVSRAILPRLTSDGEFDSCAAARQ